MEAGLPRVLRRRRGGIRRRASRVGPRAARAAPGPAEGSPADLGAALRRHLRQRRARLPDRARSQHPPSRDNGQPAALGLRLGVEAAARRHVQGRHGRRRRRRRRPCPFAAGFTRAPHANRFTGDYDDTTPPLVGRRRRAEQRAARRARPRPTAAGWRRASGSTARTQLPVVGEAAAWPSGSRRSRPVSTADSTFAESARSGDLGYTLGHLPRCAARRRGRGRRRLLRAGLDAASGTASGRSRSTCCSHSRWPASRRVLQMNCLCQVAGFSTQRGRQHCGQAYQVRPQGESPEHQAPRAQPAAAVDAAHRAEGDSRRRSTTRTWRARRAALSKTVSIVDKMATKGIIHRNTAGRYKSRLLARHREGQRVACVGLAQARSTASRRARALRVEPPAPHSSTTSRSSSIRGSPPDDLSARSVRNTRVDRRRAAAAPAAARPQRAAGPAS